MRIFEQKKWYDIFVQCLQATQLHDIDTESVRNTQRPQIEFWKFNFQGG
jgi:hypothetical protein